MCACVYMCVFSCSRTATAGRRCCCSGGLEVRGTTAARPGWSAQEAAAETNRRVKSLLCPDALIGWCVLGHWWHHDQMRQLVCFIWRKEPILFLTSSCRTLKLITVCGCRSTGAESEQILKRTWCRPANLQQGFVEPAHAEKIFSSSAGSDPWRLRSHYYVMTWVLGTAGLDHYSRRRHGCQSFPQNYEK